MGKIVAQLMWNGVWIKQNNKYHYEELDTPIRIRTLMLRKEDEPLTLENFKRKVASRMGLSMDCVPNLQISHMRPGMEDYRPTDIVDDQEVELLFYTYEARDIIRMYVEQIKGNSTGMGSRNMEVIVPRRNGSSDGSSYMPEIAAPEHIEVGRRNGEKMVPRRNLQLMQGPSDGSNYMPEIAVPSWDAGFNETDVMVVYGGGTDVAGPSGSGQQPLAIGNDDSYDNDGCGIGDDPHGLSSGEEQDSLQGDDVEAEKDVHVEDIRSNQSNSSQKWGSNLQRHPTRDVEEGKEVDGRPDGIVVISEGRPVGLEKGYIFDNRRVFRQSVLDAATKHGWAWGKPKSDQGRFTLHCRDPKCKWYVGAYKVPEHTYYQVKVYNSIHTCSIATSNYKHSNVKGVDIAFSMLDQYRNGQKRPSVAHIKDHVKNRFGSKVSTAVCYASRKRAWKLIHGNRHEQYQRLPAFFYLMQQLNPGSIVYMELDAENRFKYCFFAIKAQMDGICMMRPVLIIDAAHMKNEPMQIVVATMADSEKECYPVAWGIIDKEDNDAWVWFLTQLSTVVIDHKALVIVSDRHGAIKHAVKAVYTNANHVYCCWHIQQNLISRYGPGGWVGLFWKAARAYTKEECDILLNIMEAEYTKSVKVGQNGSMTVATYLREELTLEKWSKAYAKSTRYDVMTSNRAESINSMLREARFHCVLSYCTIVLYKMSGWFNTRRLESYNWSNRLTPEREKIMRDNIETAKLLNVVEEDLCLYRVSGRNVGMHKVSFGSENWGCACHQFQNDWQSCVHACTCAPLLRAHHPELGVEAGTPDSDGLVMYGFTSELYNSENYRQAYKGVIGIVPDQLDWNTDTIPIEYRNCIVLAPIKKVKVGAPQQKRFPSQGEKTRWPKRKSYCCSLCREEGHNAASCPHTVATPSSVGENM